MPKRVRSSAALCAVLVILVLALGLPTIAGAKRGGHKFCSKSGDFCIAVLNPTGTPRFELSTFSFTGTYDLCVTPAGGTRTCHTFKLHRARHGIFRSKVAWRANFPFGPGPHSVTWIEQGNQIGPTLHFFPFRVCSGGTAGCTPPRA